MQYFEWYLPSDGSLWTTVSKNAKALSDIGVTALWLPPAFKGQAGANDVGYGIYDLYDLGEFHQKGTIRTKYGTKDEYLQAIKDLQTHHIDVYADIVLNHKMGADFTETVDAFEANSSNRLQQNPVAETIEAWTGFNFPARQQKYSSFEWNHTHFDGVDYNQRNSHCAIYNLAGTPWDTGVDTEHANYDYLMGSDLCFSNKEVLDELDSFGQWYLDFTGVTGFRLDAVKHIPNSFFAPWLSKLRINNKSELFTVGEYWSPDLQTLQNYLGSCQSCMSLFDVPLHFNFYRASNEGQNYDMRNILSNTLMSAYPERAVTFVENHDTQRGQALETVVADWFKPLAYTMILTRSQGYPCIFYGDYYGIPSYNQPSFQNILNLLCQVRKNYVYGVQHDYFDHPDIIGWTYEGTTDHPGGCAVLVDNGPAGIKRMFIGLSHTDQTYYDVTGNCLTEVQILPDGNGDFPVNGGNISIWIPKSLD